MNQKPILGYPKMPMKKDGRYCVCGCPAEWHDDVRGACYGFDDKENICLCWSFKESDELWDWVLKQRMKNEKN